MAIALMNRAPHPNAAKVFMNWALSREGQPHYTQTLDQNSRRLDVSGGPSETQPNPAIQYPQSINTEVAAHFQSQVEQIAKEVIK